MDTRADIHVLVSAHAAKQASTVVASATTEILDPSPVLVVSPPMVHLPGTLLKRVE